jgi:hypothetical protein
MLIRFRVSNYRSLKGECTLDMGAEGKRRQGKAAGCLQVKGAAGDVLLSAGIFGANASGKSNLLNALVTMKRLVCDPMGDPAAGAPLGAMRSPFALDESSRDAATLFEVDLAIGGVRRVYGFEVDGSAVRKEWLEAYPKGQKCLLFDREGGRKNEYRFGQAFMGDRDGLKKATGPSALLLAVASRQGNPDTAPVFDWFCHLWAATSELCPIPRYSKRMACDDKSMLEKISKLMKAADTGVVKIKVAKPKITDEGAILQRLSDPGIDIQTKDRLELEYAKMKRGHDILFMHRGESGLVPMAYDNESAGTRALFTLAGPLIDALERGSLFVIDEIDSSLHPLVVKEILQLFHDAEQNKEGAQLIFSSHSALLIDDQVLGRDHIWLVEKDGHGASKLAPLAACKPSGGKSEPAAAGPAGRRAAPMPVTGPGAGSGPRPPRPRPGPKR